MLDEVLDDWETASVPTRTRGALRLLETLTKRPLEIDRALVSELRGGGLDDAALLEIGAIGFHFNFMNRMADAFDFATPTGAQERRMAKVLESAGRLFTPPEDPSALDEPVRGKDGRVRPAAIARGRRQLLTTPGRTSPELRTAVYDFVRRQWDCPGTGTAAVPASTGPYLTKLSKFAYRIVDEDVEAMRTDGYDDECIYELTMVGIFGAASVGLEQLVGALTA